MNKPSTPKTKGPAVLVGGAAVTVLALAGLFSEREEGVVLEAYADPLHGWAVPTACGGDTGPHIQRGMKFTIDQCRAMMDKRHRIVFDKVMNCMSGEVEVHHVLAPMSLTDNVGIGAVCNSTMLKQQRAGQPPAVWCRQFTEANASYAPYGKPATKANMVIEPIGWVRGAGRNCRDRRNKCYGLVLRREREQRLCLGDYTVIQQ